MRTRLVLPAVATIALGLVAPPAGASELTAADKNISLLFSITAERSTLKPVAGKNRVYTMTLRDTDPHMVWFTDRPDRDSGVWKTKWFSDAWKKGALFDDSPPNVALVLHEPSGTTDTIVAVMGEPRYSAKKDRLTARLRVLTAEQAKDVKGGLGQHADRHDGSDLPRKGGAVSLFIDNNPGKASDLWLASLTWPANVFRIHWKDGSMWRCVSAATANFQTVFNDKNIADWDMWWGFDWLTEEHYGAEPWKNCESDRFTVHGGGD